MSFEQDNFKYESDADIKRQRTIRRSLDLLTMIGLVSLLMFVLLPMAWMVITAFKTKGTAFRLRMYPKTTYLYPEKQEAAFELVIPKADEFVAHLEYDDAAATEVLVHYHPADLSAERTVAMRRSLRGVWFADLYPLDSGPFRYRLSISGQDPIADPRAPTSSLDDQAWSHTTVAEMNFASPAQSEVTVTGPNEAMARIVTETGYQVSVVLDDNRKIKLEEKQPGVFQAQFKIGDAKNYRIEEKRPFAEALAAMYTVTNFTAILNSEEFHFARYFFNSFVVAFSAAILTVFICTLAGYAFSQKVFSFREPLFKLLLASMLVPGMIFMVPQFSITLKLGWMNSYHGMVIPHIANMFGLFLLRQYISQIPSDLFAAAEIDGANELQVFRYVVIPVCLPIMVTLFLLTFVGQWSNFLWQLIVNTGDSPFITLPVGLQQFKGQNANDWEKIMAGACFSILPIAVLFLSLQKYFLEGLTAGALKE